MSETPAVAADSRRRPPRLRGAELVVFLLGASVVVALQVVLLWRLPAISAPDADAPDTSRAQPLAGTPDGAGILWINVEDTAFNPAYSTVSAGVSVEVRLRNKTREPRSLRLRPQQGNGELAAWKAVPASGEAGQTVSLPPGLFTLEDVADPRRQTVIEAR